MRASGLEVSWRSTGPGGVMADLIKSAFAREFDALLNGSRLSTARITLLARELGIGYSTLRSWRSGVHLPRVPEDNPAFRALLQSVAADRGHAVQVFDLARRAWRAAQQAKQQVGRTRPMLSTPTAPGSAALLDGQARWLLVHWPPTAAEPFRRRLSARWQDCRSTAAERCWANWPPLGA